MQGWNGNGRLALGTTTGQNQLPPTEVRNGGWWARVAVGDQHTCAIRVDRTLWCAGYNAYGQVGDATVIDKPSLVLVRTIDQYEWAAVSAGTGISCGIVSDGTTLCWGLNTNGQLGMGLTANQLVPTNISVPGSYADVSIGTLATCGLRGTPPAWPSVPALPPTPPLPLPSACWGRNTYGQFGDGSAGAQQTVEPATYTAAAWTAMSVSSTAVCAIEPGATLYCWGVDSGGGNLGTGGASSLYIPTPVVGGGSWSRVFAANEHR